MIIEIRKTSYRIDLVETSSGFDSNNLYGSNLHFDLSKDEKAILIIDLSKNLLVRNKSQNDYEDAVYLRDHIAEFSSLTISMSLFANMGNYLSKLRGRTIMVKFVFDDNSDLDPFDVDLELNSREATFRAH